MSSCFALPWLFDGVVKRFEDEETNIVNLFGWRSRSQKTVTGDRVCWIPGDPNGAVGPLVEARNPGQNPRSLGTLDELFTCEAMGADISASWDERRQYEAARWVFDAWWRAVYLTYTGRVRIVSSLWLRPEAALFRYGACIQVVCALDSMIPDAAQGVSPVDTTGLITVDELDVSKTLTVTPEAST